MFEGCSIGGRIDVHPRIFAGMRIGVHEISFFVNTNSLCEDIEIPFSADRTAPLFGRHMDAAFAATKQGPA